MEFELVAVSQSISPASSVSIINALQQASEHVGLKFIADCVSTAETVEIIGMKKLKNMNDSSGGDGVLKYESKEGDVVTLEKTRGAYS